MKHSISSQINRLSLHDSSFESVVRKNGVIELIFDWAYLDNFNEEGVEDGIIMGKTKLIFNRIKSESFIVTPPEPAKKYTVLPEEFLDNHSMVSTTSVIDDIKFVELYGFSDSNGYQCFEWSFKYDDCEISWNSFVTRTEWQNGKLPID